MVVEAVVREVALTLDAYLTFRIAYSGFLEVTAIASYVDFARSAGKQ